MAKSKKNERKKLKHDLRKLLDQMNAGQLGKFFTVCVARRVVDSEKDVLKIVDNAHYFNRLLISLVANCIKIRDVPTLQQFLIDSGQLFTKRECLAYFKHNGYCVYKR